MERAEDAGVYKLTDETAIIQTVDFFTPIVDEPYAFGQIVAVNALSDVYAMGGKPLTAMNMVCFPIKTMDISILQEILAGGLAKMREAGVILVGGHSVDDQELKYGLSVMGVIHPSKVVFNTGVKVGDRLILTKALGTGIIGTAIKKQLADKETITTAIESMATLNQKASELMQEMGVNACTDITGFGLLGHASEMIDGTGVGMIIYSRTVPFFPVAKDLVEKGITPGGLNRNREFRRNMIDINPGVADYLPDIFFDPQTSGGLLISVSEPKAPLLLKKMHQVGIKEAAIIGEVTTEPKGKIILK